MMVIMRDVRGSVGLACAVSAAICGCGRVAFDPLPSADARDASGSDDGATDATDDASPATPDNCPPTVVLADDFTDGTISTGPAGTWGGTCQSTVVVFEMQGRLVVSFPTSSVTASHAGVYSARYDLTSACALIRAPVVPDQATEAYAYLTVEEPSGANRSKATIAVASGNLEIRKETMTGLQILGTVPYNAGAHLWWRIRTGAGSIAWETSADRITWATHHQEAAYFDLSVVDVVIGAGTDLASTNAGTGELDDAWVYVP